MRDAKRKVLQIYEHPKGEKARKVGKIESERLFCEPTIVSPQKGERILSDMQRKQCMCLPRDGCQRDPAYRERYLTWVKMM